MAEYAEAMRCGAKFPPLILFYDGVQHWMGDGFHRYHACRAAEIIDVQSDVHTGTKRDARLFSAGANNDHGMRPTNADKRKAAMVLLLDDEWVCWSDVKIAKHCHVTQPFVSKLRKSLEAPAPITVIGLAPQATPGDRTATNAVAKPAAKPKPEAEADDGMITNAELLLELETDNQHLSAQVEALSKDDVAAELKKQIGIRQGIEARLGQEMDRSNHLDTELRRFGKYFDALRKLLGVEKNSQVLAAVRSMIKEIA